MRYLKLAEVLELYYRIMEMSGGALGIHSRSALESALAQPRMMFGGKELYPTLIDKAAALGHSIVMNHPFVDGNKRAGHAAMEVFLILNGTEIVADVDVQEDTVLSLAAGKISREDFTTWLANHTREQSG